MSESGPLPLSETQLESLRASSGRVNVWSGAIRSGKTIASLLRWLIYVAHAPRGGQLVVVGRTRDSAARNVFAPLQDPSLFGDLADQVHYTAGAPKATILGRTVYVLGASDAKAEKVLRGLTCAGAYVDECTVVDEQFFVQLLGRMSVTGAQLFGTTNPDNPAHWLKRRYLDRLGELPDWRSFAFTLDDNPALTEAYKASVRREYTGLWFRRFILGEWVAAEGAVYDMWQPDRHVVSELPPIRQVLAVGVDYGTRNPFSALTLALTDDGRLAVTREWRHDPALTRRQLTDADFSRELRGWLGAERPRWLVVDPSAASFKLQLFHDGQSNVMDANNEVVDGIRQVASLLATDRLVVHESCEGLITEFPGYSWDDAAAEKGEDKPIKTADHSLDALRYAVKTTEFMWRPMISAV